MSASTTAMRPVRLPDALGGRAISPSTLFAALFHTKLCHHRINAISKVGYAVNQGTVNIDQHHLRTLQFHIKDGGIHNY